MVNPIVLDIIALILIVLAVLEGRRKGFVKMLWRVGAWILTLVLVLVLIKPVTEWAMTTEMVQNLIDNFMHDFAQSNVNSFTPEKISEITNLPIMLIPDDWGSMVPGEDGVLALAQYVAAVLVKIVVALGLFIIIRILLSILYHILNLATRLPIIKGVNKLLGMVMGLINIMFIFYIVLGIAVIYIEPGSQWDMTINGTYIVKNFYSNNILLNLINL